MSDRCVVLYNTDYDAELAAAGADESSVEVSARAVRDALRTAGWRADLVGVAGLDLFAALTQLSQDPPRLVFNLCESLAGDARNEIAVPPLLDLLGLRYTGSDALALGLCLHKARAKALLQGANVPTPPAFLLEQAAQLTDARFAEIGAPAFLKLAHEDASIGIEATNVCHSADAARARAAVLIAEFAQPVLIERYIDGREVNATVLGSGPTARVLPLHEIDFSAMPVGRPHIVSYAAKWDEHHADYGGTKPVALRDVTNAQTARICEVALAAYRVLGLRDYGRVDMRLDASGAPYVIDVNPNCDISPDAGVARAFAADGLAYTAMIAAIADAALRRQI